MNPAGRSGHLTLGGYRLIGAEAGQLNSRGFMLIAFPKTKSLVRRAMLGFLLLWVASGTVRAQQAPSPLTGKIIHLYDPFDGVLPLVDLSGTGYDMTHETGNWYKFEFSSVGASLASWMNSFGI